MKTGNVYVCPPPLSRNGSLDEHSCLRIVAERLEEVKIGDVCGVLSLMVVWLGYRYWWYGCGKRRNTSRSLDWDCGVRVALDWIGEMDGLSRGIRVLVCIYVGIYIHVYILLIPESDMCCFRKLWFDHCHLRLLRSCLFSSQWCAWGFNIKTIILLYIIDITLSGRWWWRYIDVEVDRSGVFEMRYISECIWEKNGFCLLTVSLWPGRVVDQQFDRWEWILRFLFKLANSYASIIRLPRSTLKSWIHSSRLCGLVVLR